MGQRQAAAAADAAPRALDGREPQPPRAGRDVRGGQQPHLHGLGAGFQRGAEQPRAGDRVAAEGTRHGAAGVDAVQRTARGGAGGDPATGLTARGACAAAGQRPVRSRTARGCARNASHTRCCAVRTTAHSPDPRIAPWLPGAAIWLRGPGASARPITDLSSDKESTLGAEDSRCTQDDGVSQQKTQRRNAQPEEQGPEFPTETESDREAYGGRGSALIHLPEARYGQKGR